MPSADAVHRSVVGALARGILGDAYSADVPPRVIEIFGRLAYRKETDQLLGVLRALDTRAGAAALTGRPIPVSWLTPTEAEALIRRWKASRLRFLQDLASGLVSVSMAAAYGSPGPLWEEMGYPGPIHPPSTDKPHLQPLQLTSDEILYCDVVIVGSGAGGAVVAAELAAAGVDVIVLEKGSYRDRADFTQIESEAQRDMYLYGGTFTTVDHGIRLFAGATVGGGTVINWSTSWKTPEPILREWAEVSGIDAFVNGEIEQSLDEVCARLNVNFDSSASAKRDELMEEGLKRLGWHVDAMPRNVKGCTQDEACGFCTFGCRIGAKQSALETYLPDAARAGARVIPNVDVRKVIIRDARAQGVEGTCNGHRLTVNALAVVAACGSLETPALLLRSGLRGQVGHNLRLHPATTVVGLFDEEVRAWGGVMQGRYSNELDGPWTGGYGATLETGPAHPVLGGIMPWTGAEQHRDLMRSYRNLSVVGFPSRERGHGRVKIDRKGVPRVHYEIPAEDEGRIADAVIAAGKVLEAAGARRIFSVHKDLTEYTPGSPGAHERWADETRRKGYRKGAASFFSMHQMGSCRMGVDPKTSAIGADNETHEVKGLYVTDGSTFPTPSGVNPMISIYGIAHRAAQKIVGKLS